MAADPAVAAANVPSFVGTAGMHHRQVNLTDYVNRFGRLRRCKVVLPREGILEAAITAFQHVLDKEKREDAEATAAAAAMQAYRGGAGGSAAAGGGAGMEDEEDEYDDMHQDGNDDYDEMETEDVGPSSASQGAIPSSSSSRPSHSADDDDDDDDDDDFAEEGGRSGGGLQHHHEDEDDEDDGDQDDEDDDDDEYGKRLCRWCDVYDQTLTRLSSVCPLYTCSRWAWQTFWCYEHRTLP